MLMFKGARERVKMGVPRTEILRVLVAASVWSAKAGVDVIVNSLNDHQHMDKSLHYEDLAVDLSVTPFNVVEMARFVDFLEKNLWNRSEPFNTGYDIIYGDKYHKRHVHVEYDVRQRARRDGKEKG